MEKISTTRKTPRPKRKRVRNNQKQICPRTVFCHRQEARHHNTSGFNSVWLSLYKPNVSGKSNRYQEKHIYFLCKILQDSLLTQRLNQGLLAMIGLSKTCFKIPDLFCMAGLEILKQIPYSHFLCLQYYKNMYLVCYDHRQEILLNLALYLVLRQKDVKEALQLLMSKVSTLQPRPFSENFLHKAYIGLFEYLQWQVQQSKTVNDAFRHSDEDVSDEELLGEFDKKGAAKNIRFSATKAMGWFKEVFDVPGVWDIFVPAYKDLLEHHEGVDETRRFLENYRDKNMLNPNAHRYLYHYLKSNFASDKDLIDVLHGLVKLDATTELLEDFIDLKVKTGSKDSILKMLFQKLDHAGCKYDEKTWKILESYLMPKDGAEVVPLDLKELDFFWEKDRKSWWPPYHFRVPRNLGSLDVWSVMLTKANIAGYLLGKENDFSKEIRSRHRKHLKNTTAAQESGTELSSCDDD